MQTNKRRILVPLSLRNQHCREVFFGIGFKTARVPFLCTRNLFRFGMVEDFPTVNSGGRRIRREGASRSGRRILRNESLPVREGIARSEKFSRECGQRLSPFPFPHRCGKMAVKPDRTLFSVCQNGHPGPCYPPRDPSPPLGEKPGGSHFQRSSGQSDGERRHAFRSANRPSIIRSTFPRCSPT